MNEKDAARRGLELVTFMLGGELYGLDIMLVQEIIRLPELTRAPQSPAFVAGMLNLRGAVLPVVDLRLRMGMRPVEADKRTRVIITGLDSARLGLVVDSVADVLRLDASEVQLPPAVARSEDRGYVSGVARLESGRLLLILDLSVVSPAIGAPVVAMAGPAALPGAPIIFMPEARARLRPAA